MNDYQLLMSASQHGDLVFYFSLNIINLSGWAWNTGGGTLFMLPNNNLD